jgi:MinD superfamily P-loop ATPase
MIKIAIASGKGGTGKTFVATNIFYSLLHNGINAILIDCDAEAPNACAFFEKKLTKCCNVTQMVPVVDTDVCTFCGKCHEFCNYNAIFILPPMKIIRVIEDLCHGCGACSYACETGAITEKPLSLGTVSCFYHLSPPDGFGNLIEARTNVGVMSPVAVIKAAIKHSGTKEKIFILDSPPGTSCPFIQTVTASDYVILVTEPTPFGLSDLKQSVETLKLLNVPYGVIINRAGLGNNDVSDYLRLNNISLLMEIGFNRQIAEAYSKGQIVSETMPLLRNEFYNTITRISQFYGDSSNQW